jgi:hypothetical protein
MTATLSPRHPAAFLPKRHLLLQIGLNLVGQILETYWWCARSLGKLSLEEQSCEFQDWRICCETRTSFSTVTVWKWRQRHADRIADALLQQH